MKDYQAERVLRILALKSATARLMHFPACQPPPSHPFWQFIGTFFQLACSKSCYGIRKYDKSLQMEVVDALTAPLTADNSLATQSPAASLFALKCQDESPGSPIVCHLAFITY